MNENNNSQIDSRLADNPASQENGQCKKQHKRATNKEILKRAKTVYALRMLGVKRAMIAELFGYRMKTVTDWVNKFIEKHNVKKTEKLDYLAEREYMTCLSDVITSQNHAKINRLLNVLTKKGLTGMLWIESLDDNLIDIKAAGKWTLYSPVTLPEKPDIAWWDEVDQHTINMADKYHSFVDALRSLGIGEKTVLKLLKHFNAVAYDDFKTKHLKPAFEASVKRSYYLLPFTKAARSTLTENIKQLIASQKQGVIYLEYYAQIPGKLFEKKANSQWLIIYGEQDSNFFKKENNRMGAEP